MKAVDQRRLTPVLAVLGVLLAVVWLLLLTGVGRTAHWAAARPLVPLSAVGHAAELPRPLPLQQFARVWQTPLFSPDRKPVAHAVDGGSSLGDLDLTGILLTPGLRMALLHDKNGDRQLRLREGESLPDGSVTLVEVRPRSALFDSSAGRTELKLPAGAPIDRPKPAATNGERNATAPADLGGNPGNPMMQVVPGGQGAQKSAAGPGREQTPIRPRQLPTTAPSTQSPLPDPAASAAMDRLRETITKRRAAEAAAANEGVR